MAQFSAEHVGHKIEVGNSFGDDFLGGAGHIHAMVVDAVNIEAV